MNSVLDKEIEGRGEPFFWHTRPTPEQVALMAQNSLRVVNTYWQEPILTAKDLGEVVEPTISYRYPGPIVAPLSSYHEQSDIGF